MLTRLAILALTTLVAITDAKRRNRSGDKKKDDDVARHEKDFIAFDINQDNFVDASEVRQLHKNLKQEDVSAFFIAADVNEDGLITLEEYVNASLAQEAGEISQ